MNEFAVLQTGPGVVLTQRLTNSTVNSVSLQMLGFKVGEQWLIQCTAAAT